MMLEISFKLKKCQISQITIAYPLPLSWLCGEGQSTEEEKWKNERRIVFTQSCFPNKEGDSQKRGKQWQSK